MKSLKAKLMTSVVMLLVAAIALSTASYAWFTISTNPEVKDLKATVSTNENLEIAYARDLKTLPSNYSSRTTNAEQWGNLIDNTYTTNDNYSVDYSALDTTLRPCHLGYGDNDTTDVTTDDDMIPQLKKLSAYDSKGCIKIGSDFYTIDNVVTEKGKFYYPVYEYTVTYGESGKEKTVQNSDGRICYFVELEEIPCQIENPKYVKDSTKEEEKDEFLDTGVGYLMQVTGDEPSAIYDEDKEEFVVTDGVIYGYYVDYWVRSNLSGILRLSDEASRSGQELDGNADNDPDGEGSWFKTDEIAYAKEPTAPADNASAEVKAQYAIDKAAYDEYQEKLRKNVEFASAIRIALRDVTEEIKDTDPLDSTKEYVVTDPVVLDDEDTADVNEAEKYSVARKIKSDDKMAYVYDAVAEKDRTKTQLKRDFDFNQNLVELEANLAKTLRFYVYLNGSEVTNKAASVDGFTNSGELNLQFRLVATGSTDGVAADEVVDKPMPVVDDKNLESAES